MSLDKIRQEIDTIDEQMKALFLQRMDLAKQVIEEKKQTGAPVYAPKREEEVLTMRTQGTPEEYVKECRAFFRQMMGISRTYQYSKILKRSEDLKKVTEGKDSLVLKFSCEMGSDSLAACLNAVSLSGLRADKITLENGICEICLTGGFSETLKRAAVLQILEENLMLAIYGNK